ncbi:beta-ketoacyl-ACP synthase III [Rhodocytophaga aerolata]|uniref:Beta-ketoacyl-[acyl-carrier-protein] synthase III n=1 Tax=Rhodocytophaga aerolata TaxID=455078 RepID=A0ABT8R6Z0_9BACT|nr:beta-ketoacyl-ACP synthase III [Rhodocytophaga aerolata]MDO1447870.1 beta-ketoacyl-ACP synthase III [Rhodocytophaga aerolata]
MFYSRITGVGHYVPENIVTNQDLEKRMDTSDAWIQERTGIKERRFFTPGTDTVANMGTRAARMAMQRANVQASDIDFIVFATITPDYYFPGSGVLLQRELELTSVGALDIRNQCSGFVYALSVADQFIKTGMYKTILVVGAEIQSSIMDISNKGRTMAVIFGDGAGAVVLQATEDKDHRILSTHLHADGKYAEELIVKDPGSSREGRWITKEMVEQGSTDPYMNGNAVFKHAVVRFPEVIKEALDANGYTKDNIDLLIPHQANYRITNYIREQLGLPEEKVYSNIHKYGNTTAASIPIALSEAWEEGKLQPGYLLCLAAFGSGFTWASALIRW